ncbi:hypothetical protein E3N88_44859 [Mikania micrantha]|uniref:Uncharacterized protein n=1 Tax=Mikania micrantha TaxID=192012 RepID=A0A5N6LB32_9ASTR|nr:hypothetical protein E3N88_44859 [Mikania micrantha]
MASESTFNLEDLDTFFAVKKEKTSPSAPKPRAMTTRSSKSTKKRKGVDTVDLEEPSDLSISDLLKRASAKYAIEKEQNEKQIEVLEDQKKIFTAKAGHFEKELVKVKKQMKDMEATHKLQFKEHIDGAKKSAAIAVLRAKIQLVNQAKTDGVDSLAKNMKEWGKILATLAGDKVEASVDTNKAGEVGETSKAGEVEVIGAEAGMAEQEVTMGDDDNDAKSKWRDHEFHGEALIFFNFCFNISNGGTMSFMAKFEIPYLNIPKYFVVFPSILEIQSCTNRKTRKLGTSPRYWRQGRLKLATKAEILATKAEMLETKAGILATRPEYWRQGRDTGD